MNGSLARIAIMLLVSVGLGTVSAYRQGLPWIADVEAVRERLERREVVSKREFPTLTLEELREAIAAGAVIIDSRSPAEFNSGHLVVSYEPPVLNIYPTDGLEQHLGRLNALFGMPVVMYCTSLDCDLAEQLYVMFEQFGLLDNFAGIRIFKPGWVELERTDLPRGTGPDTWAGWDADDGYDDMSFDDPDDFFDADAFEDGDSG